jgi:cathepsin B
MQQHGIPTLTCVPYKAKDGTCPSTCSGGGSIKLYKAASVSTYKGAASIQSAIMAGGPIETAFTVYQDFMSYKSGVYVHTYGGVVGGHAVKMVGWGVSGAHNYWI